MPAGSELLKATPLLCYRWQPSCIELRDLQPGPCHLPAPAAACSDQSHIHNSQCVFHACRTRTPGGDTEALLQFGAQLYQIHGCYDLALAIFLHQQQPAKFTSAVCPSHDSCVSVRCELLEVTQKLCCKLQSSCTKSRVAMAWPKPYLCTRSNLQSVTVTSAACATHLDLCVQDEGSRRQYRGSAKSCSPAVPKPGQLRLDPRNFLAPAATMACCSHKH